MKILELHIPITPCQSTHQSGLRVIKAKDGRCFVGKYQTSEVKKWSDQFEAMLRSAKKDWVCPDGPLRVRLSFFFPHNKHISRKHATRIIPKFTKPDVDNMAKSVLDSMVNSGVLIDDSRITELCLSKWHTHNHPQIIISVESLALLLE